MQPPINTTVNSHRPHANRPQSNRLARPAVTTNPTPSPVCPGGSEQPSWEELFGRR